MDKTKLLPDLMKVIGDIHTLADSLEALYAAAAGDNPPVEEKTEKEEPVITLEQVRAVLADKSRSGHTAQVRDIIRKFGADKLSGIDTKDYAAVLKEAEVL